jgi:hypothetical protein
MRADSKQFREMIGWVAETIHQSSGLIRAPVHTGRAISPAILSVKRRGEQTGFQPVEKIDSAAIRDQS